MTPIRETDGDKVAHAIYETLNDDDLIGGGGESMSLVYAVYLVSRGLFKIAEHMVERNLIEVERNKILATLDFAVKE